jgi:hypothetical protein
MSALYYWDGAEWKPISTGGGGGVPGPAGPPGESVEVFGPQAGPPVPNRKGDVWLFDGIVQRSEDFPPMPPCTPPVVKNLKETTDPIVVPLSEKE